MSFEKVRESLASDLDEIRSAGLWKSERNINSNQANHISLEDGQHVTNMCANNYLGLANDKRIIHYCNEYRKKENIDTFIFGHSHYKNKERLSEDCYYFNCGEWMTDSPFLEFDGKYFELKSS